MSIRDGQLLDYSDLFFFFAKLATCIFNDQFKNISSSQRFGSGKFFAFYSFDIQKNVYKIVFKCKLYNEHQNFLKLCCGK